MATFFKVVRATHEGKPETWLRNFKMTMRGLFDRDVPRALISAAVGIASYVFFKSPDPGLVALLTFVVIQAIVYLKVGYLMPKLAGPGVSYSLFNNPATRTGLDILAVLGGAAFIVWLGSTL